MQLEVPRKAQQVRKLKFSGYVHIPVKGQSLEQPQGCSFLIPFCPHEGTSASWVRQSWWLSAQHHAQAVKISQLWHPQGCPQQALESNPAPASLAQPAEHTQGKQGHGLGFPGVCWQCWNFFVLFYPTEGQTKYLIIKVNKGRQFSVHNYLTCFFKISFWFMRTTCSLNEGH